MKKSFYILGVFSMVLAGCGGKTVEEFIENRNKYTPDVIWYASASQSMADELSTKKDPYLTREVGSVYNRYKDDVFTKVGERPACWNRDRKEYDTDDCVLHRRNRECPDVFFDYARFLPENTWIKTDDDWRKFNYKSEGMCKIDGLSIYRHAREMTEAEQQKMVNDALEEHKQCVRNLAVSNIIQQEEERMAEEERQKEEQLEKERKKAEQEENRRKAQMADCKQAKEKAKAREAEIEQKLGKKIVPGTAFSEARVVDFADSGVFIENDCGEGFREAAGAYIALNSGMGDLAYAKALACEPNRRFIYTDSKKYANGDRFSDKETVYMEVEPYRYKTITGGINSVRAYKKTQYKTEEITYKAYVKDKSTYCSQ